MRRPGLFAAVASLLTALLITGAALAATLQVHFGTTADRLVTIGDVFTGGIFFLALTAGAVAILSYADSSRRPSLFTSWSFESLPGGKLLYGPLPRDELSSRELTQTLASGVVVELVPLEPVKLRVRVENHGQVAAKNVTVAFYLEGIFFNPPPTVELGSSWRFLCLSNNGWQVQWESRPVYPGAVPRESSVDLAGMWAVPDVTHTTWGSVVTLADDLKLPDTHLLEVNVAPPPARPTPAPPHS